MRYHYDRTDAAHSPHRAETGTLYRRRMGRDQKGFEGRWGAGLPGSGDMQLLFIQSAVKM